MAVMLVLIAANSNVSIVAGERRLCFGWELLEYMLVPSDPFVKIAMQAVEMSKLFPRCRSSKWVIPANFNNKSAVSYSEMLCLIQSHP